MENSVLVDTPPPGLKFHTKRFQDVVGEDDGSLNGMTENPQETSAEKAKRKQEKRAKRRERRKREREVMAAAVHDESVMSQEKAAVNNDAPIRNSVDERDMIVEVEVSPKEKTKAQRRKQREQTLSEAGNDAQENDAKNDSEESTVDLVGSLLRQCDPLIDDEDTMGGSTGELREFKGKMSAMEKKTKRKRATSMGEGSSQYSDVHAAEHLNTEGGQASREAEIWKRALKEKKCEKKRKLLESFGAELDLEDPENDVQTGRQTLKQSPESQDSEIRADIAPTIFKSKSDNKNKKRKRFDTSPSEKLVGTDCGVEENFEVNDSPSENRKFKKAREHEFSGAGRDEEPSTIIVPMKESGVEDPQFAAASDATQGAPMTQQKEISSIPNAIANSIQGSDSVGVAPFKQKSKKERQADRRRESAHRPEVIAEKKACDEKWVAAVATMPNANEIYAEMEEAVTAAKNLFVPEDFEEIRQKRIKIAEVVAARKALRVLVHKAWDNDDEELMSFLRPLENEQYLAHLDRLRDDRRAKTKERLQESKVLPKSQSQHIVLRTNHGQKMIGDVPRLSDNVLSDQDKPEAKALNQERVAFNRNIHGAALHLQSPQQKSFSQAVEEITRSTYKIRHLFSSEPSASSENVGSSFVGPQRQGRTATADSCFIRNPASPSRHFPPYLNPRLTKSSNRVQAPNKEKEVAKGWAAGKVRGIVGTHTDEDPEENVAFSGAYISDRPQGVQINEASFKSISIPPAKSYNFALVVDKDKEYGLTMCSISRGNVAVTLGKLQFEIGEGGMFRIKGKEVCVCKNGGSEVAVLHVFCMP